MWRRRKDTMVTTLIILFTMIDNADSMQASHAFPQTPAGLGDGGRPKSRQREGRPDEEEMKNLQ